MLGYGRDESAPTPGGMFATHFRGCSPRYRRPLAAKWQTVSSRRGPIYRARIYENTYKMANGYVRVIK
ncbi:MAG: hypothetical protein HXN87_08965 [Prevotella pallens]|nr:hypothetical protein [Prevotella pallens]